MDLQKKNGGKFISLSLLSLYLKMVMNFVILKAV